MWAPRRRPVSFFPLAAPVALEVCCSVAVIIVYASCISDMAAFAVVIGGGAPFVLGI